MPEILTPRAFLPLLGKHAYKGAKGGRGGGKSYLFADMLVEECCEVHTRFACVREVQSSIKDSVKQLIEDRIRYYGVESEFKITEREIVCPRTDSLVIFRGLQTHTSAGLKSLAGFTRAWYEEAQSLSKRSMTTAVPTFRENNTQQWFSWNPDKHTDPVDVFFAENDGDPDFVCVTVNYPDNPFFPDKLRRDMERDRLRDPDKYGHVWLGGYRKNSEARVFRNWRVERFETPANAQFYFGADWGYAADPTVLIRCFIQGRTLFVDKVVWKLGCEIDRTPALFDKIPGSRKFDIRADSARPETISYMQRNGFPRLKAATKGPGSVEDGIEFLKSYDIVVHPDCKDPDTGINHVSDELTQYSYEMDKKTEEITCKLEDKKNHTIDSLRYALENVRRRGASGSEELRL